MANLTAFPGGAPVRASPAPQAARRSREPDRYVNIGGTSMPGAFVLLSQGRGWIQDGNENAASLDRGSGFWKKHCSRTTLPPGPLALIEALLARSRPARDAAGLRLAEEQGRLLMQAASQWAPAQLAWAMLLEEIDRKPKRWRRCNRRCASTSAATRPAYRWRKPARTKTGAARPRTYFKQAIRLRPAYPQGLREPGLLLLHNGRYDEALVMQKKATALAPGNLDGFNIMGAIYLSKGDRENARLMFERANAIEPNAIAQSNLATIYFFDGDYRKALPLFHAVARETDNHIMWGNLADTYRQLPDQRTRPAGPTARRSPWPKRPWSRRRRTTSSSPAWPATTPSLGEKAKGPGSDRPRPRPGPRQPRNHPSGDPGPRGGPGTLPGPGGPPRIPRAAGGPGPEMERSPTWPRCAPIHPTGVARQAALISLWHQANKAQARALEAPARRMRMKKITVGRHGRLACCSACLRRCDRQKISRLRSRCDKNECAGTFLHRHGRKICLCRAAGSHHQLDMRLSLFHCNSKRDAVF